MSCSFCGYTHCMGTCLSVQQGAPLVFQGQPGQVVAYGQLPNPVWQNPFNVQGVLVDYSISEFLENIADKSDSDSCIAFIERQQKRSQKLALEIELLKKACQDDLDSAEKEFLAKCHKYRPSITPDLLTRVKGLKAFY
jgi:hypothetical protein